MQFSGPDKSRHFVFLTARGGGRLLFAVSVAWLLFLTLFRLHRGLDFDDSYMFARYAHNILSYGNYGWNPHEHTYGCTNILFTFFITLLKLLETDRAVGIAGTLLFASFFWAVLALALIFRTVRELTASRTELPAWVPGLLIVTLTAAPVLSYNTISGMDTTFSLFCNVLTIRTIFRFQQNTSGKRLFLAAAASYLVFLCRPDCGIYTLFFPVLFFAGHKMPWRRILAFYLVLILMLLTDTAIKYYYFGNPLPLPYYVKSNNYYQGYLGAPEWNMLLYVLDFFLDFGFLFLAFLLAAGKPQWKKFLPFAIPVLATLGYYFTVMQIMGYHSRYYLPSMPFFVIGTVYAITDLKEFRISTDRLKLAAGWVVVLLLLQFAAQPYWQYLHEKSRTDAAAYVVPASAEDKKNCLGTSSGDALGKMTRLLKLLPDDSTVAATEYGLLSVEAPRLKFLDLCGLHNADVAIHGYNDDMLRRWKPTVIWLPHPDYTFLKKQILTGPWFRQHYDYYPGAMIFGVAVLKQSAQYASLTRYLLETACKP